MRQKKKKKSWGWQLSSWQMFFLGGGKCPNLGVVNVRILGVVNVLLANDSQSPSRVSYITPTTKNTQMQMRNKQRENYNNYI